MWHTLVPGVGPGCGTAFAHGAVGPARGIRCVETKLLLDPYARAINGDVTFGPAVLGYDVHDPEQPSSLDSAGSMPRSVVVDPTFDWAGDRRPHHRYADTVFYELHPKGFTRLHPAVPPELQGTYAGLAHDAVVQHLVDLGVTAVELLPVHHSVPEAFIVAAGRTNYWGYNTIGYFAPHAAYSAAARAGNPGGQVAEFKTMVRRLHAAGLEVILDVVFNHTAEADHTGPTLCHRGFDNPAYYRLDPDDPRRYVDTTGCGNSLNVGHSVTLQLIMDSLRYWLEEMHVDGFRFDLATALAREDGDFTTTAAFFDLVAQDPIVSRPSSSRSHGTWARATATTSGGSRPCGANGTASTATPCATTGAARTPCSASSRPRLTGSADLFGGSRRRPSASVNLITVHDGFTLHDLGVVRPQAQRGKP